MTEKVKKIAAFVMDVEDWYHLDYVDREKVDCNISVLDGMTNFANLLLDNGVKSATFSIVGDLVNKLVPELQKLHAQGFELACHDWDHIRPVEKSPSLFRADTIKVKKALESITGQSIIGYRAPSYGIDRERVDILRELGFRYDASRIDFSAHKLYGQIDMAGFRQVRKNIWQKAGFFEFGVGTVSVAGVTLPVSGGGYIRCFPWPFMSMLIKRYIKAHDFYLFYIHPYELTSQTLPNLPGGVNAVTRLKYRLGKSQTAPRIVKLIEMLKKSDFTFMSLGECVNYYSS